jgi:hypothetical protein
VAAPLKIAQEIDRQVIEPPPCLISCKANLACKLSTHAHGHGTESMLNASPDCRLGAIQFFRCVTQRMIARSFFMDEAFEASQIPQFLEALA